MFFFFFKQKTAYEMRISDWSSDVCSSDLPSYYPADYPEIVAAAKKEGRLLVYSSMTTDQWSGVVAQYRRLYPSITVETLDLGTSEITERYLAERGSRSEERRVGKGCGRTCRSRGWTYH